MDLQKDSACDTRLLNLVAEYNPSNVGDYNERLLHLLRQAMSHRSFVKSGNNERLEYLGDAVLGLIVADYLIKRYPCQEEGFLTEMRARIVNGDQLNSLAIRIGLDGMLCTSRPLREMSRRVMGDALEAFIGAMFLGMGFEFVCAWVTAMLERHLDFAPLVRSLITVRTIHKYCGMPAGMRARQCSQSSTNNGITANDVECISRMFAR